MLGHGRRGMGSQYEYMQFTECFLIKQHLFPAIRRVSTLFGRARSATCLGGALLSITGSLPTCIPSRSEEGEEKRHMRATLGDVAHGEQAHGEGVKCFRVEVKMRHSPITSRSYSLHRSPKSVGKSNSPEHQAAARHLSNRPLAQEFRLSVFSPLEPTHVLSD